jgi:hypothetical protein
MQRRGLCWDLSLCVLGPRGNGQQEVGIPAAGGKLYALNGKLPVLGATVAMHILSCICTLKTGRARDGDVSSNEEVGN